MKKGLKLFGEAGAQAVVTEMQQLHDCDVIILKHSSMLTQEEKQHSLQYLMFLKQKRCGCIKGRGCADGRKQHVYKTKEETSTPTVSIELLFLSCIIDAKEGHKVATCNISGAFMQADIDEIIHVKLEGPLATLLTRVDPEKYSKCITIKNGKKVMYIHLAKALYSTMQQAALLFWKDLTGYLVEQGFELNPYDECVANRQINGSQCMVLWHIDDMKISHVSDKVLDKVIAGLNEQYGKITPLTVTRGKVHDYLGMTIDYRTPRKVIIHMDDYIKGIINEAPSNRDGVVLVLTPAVEHLFSVNEDAEPLGSAQAELFHHLTAKLLFLCK